jgi:hypothetical protein
MTDDIIARAGATMEAITPGEWNPYRNKDGSAGVSSSGGPICYIAARNDSDIPSWNDAYFISWCSTGVPELVAELKAARGDQVRWKQHRGREIAREAGWLSS